MDEKTTVDLQQIISEVRKNYINERENPQEFFTYLLKLIIELTKSSYAFIGEIKQDPISKSRYLKTFALTDISWNEETSLFFKEHAPHGLEFKNLNTLFGQVIKTGELLITNDAKNDPYAGGIPQGHPPLNAFMGVPLKLEGDFVGMIGLANCPEGYTAIKAKTLSPLFIEIAELMQRYKKERESFEIFKFNAFYKQALDEFAIVAITDRKGKINYVNDLFCDISGYTREELIGQDHRILNSGNMGQEFFRQMWQTIANGKIWNGDICNKKKNGDRYWVATTIIPFKDDNGFIERYISIRRDITLEKRQRAELEQAYHQAERATQSKSDFLSSMSHEIRTPLNGIIGVTELLFESSLSHEQLELAKTIKQSGKSLLAIINDILDFSKIEAGKMDFEEIQFDFNGYLLDLTKSFRFLAQEKSLDFEVITMPYTYLVKGDQGRIGQILNNLISNSLKFTLKGKVSVKLEMSGRAGITLALLSISDTGIGIPEKNKEFLFQAFSQAEQSTSRRFGGTGLGLCISKRLVEIMGGRIYFTSEENKGTTFFIELPLTTGEAINHRPSVISNQLHPSACGPFQGRILVAEDNPTNQIVIARMLEKLGLKYHLVGNGHEVLLALKEAKYDVILMDVQMPEMDGYQTTRFIRNNDNQSAQIKSIPIIALTANAIKGDEEKCALAGMDAYLTKPITKTKLEEMLRRFL